ncbi:hypothetical protein PV327_009687 [Microctonus hyperodae]|uniref:Caspase-8 n=1 Tax=Microctonus hyperodae TaxID=165561 RepID=A0AA39F0J4_MICHY|nr:hypothetical protein PV327_009687 [Microctonus hyperodae]
MDGCVLKMIENELEINEKISILFLMLDNYNCFDKLFNLYQNYKCDTNINNYIISDFINEITEWEDKFIEALCIVKNYKVLINLGECINNLQLKYLSRETRISYKINLGAKILHKLFDSFTTHDLEIFLNSVYKDIIKDDRLNNINIIELHALYWIHIGYISISSGNGSLGKLLKHLKQQGQYDTPIYIDIEGYVRDNVKKIHFNNFKSHNDTQNNVSNAEKSQNTSDTLSEEDIFIKNGICLIINEVNFPHTEYDSRESSTIDALNLKKTFNGMKFEVELYNDITAGEIIEILNKLNEINTKNYDCLVLCILSHGYPGGFISVDGTEISIDIIEQKICSSAYKNAVKILIVQACQGQNTGLAIDPNNLATDGINKIQPLKRQLTNIDNYKLFFSFMSTMKHHISIRHRTEGSWFIEDVCDVLRSQKTTGKNISIDQWSKEVKKKVQSRRGYIGKGELAGQLPETRDRLAKEVFFPLYDEIKT